MSAYVTTGKNGGKIKKGGGSGGGKKSSGGRGNSGGKGGKGGKSGSSSSKKQTAFEKWLEKLFDWIEVRLDRIQRRIDNATQQAENSIGYLTKNSFVNTAMNETSSLIANNQAGEQRYYQQADAVYQQATFGKNKLLSADKAQKIIQKIKDGTIDINEYSEKERKFIDAYKEWYDKALDCRDAVYQLQQQLKELQQTKLDNITEEFETLANSFEAIKASSEATVEYYKAAGRATGTVDKDELKNQLSRQEEITDTLIREGAAYRAELANAAKIFGTNSNEYREAQNKLEEINKSLIESQTTELELSKTIRELSFELRNYFIKRVKALVDKFASIASLAEKRGTTSVYDIGTRQTEDLYQDQIRHNNDLILKYYEDINDKRAEIAEEGWDINSQQYEDAYNYISQAEAEILSLLSTNEDLKESIRTFRWKGYNEFQEQLNTINSDLEHLQGFIRDGDLMDDDAQFTNLGFAQIALIGEQMDTAEKRIRNAQGAISKLDEEYQHHIISLEKYNEELDAQIGIIQDASGAMFDYQQKLADMYIDQITAENEALQDLISARKDALSAKKEYYDYDKTLKNKNRDIAQLQAQINALNGVTNDAAKAKRAQLQAQLAEKQEDLDDTLYNHSIDLQQQGYDKLSEDMQTALDNAVKLINGDQKVLQDTANHMLDQLRLSGLEQKDIINQLISDNGTRVHDFTQPIIDKLEGEGGVNSLLDSIGISVATIGEAIQKQALDSTVSSIKTELSTVENSLKEDVGDQLKLIEFALGSLNPTEEDTAKIERERQEKLAELNKQIEELTYQIEMEKGNINANEAIISEKQSQKNVAQGNIDTLYNNIASLYAQRDADYAQANANNAAASIWMAKAQNAKKKARKNEYTNNANILKQQAEQYITSAKNAQVQIDTLEAAKNGVVDYNSSIINTLTSEINSLNDTVSGYKTNLDDLNDQLKELQAKKLELELPESITTPETARGEDHISGVEINNTQTPKTVYDTNDAAAQTQATQAAADAAQAAAQAAAMTAQLTGEIVSTVNKNVGRKISTTKSFSSFGSLLGFAKGTKKVPEDLLAWTNEYADKVGSEMIVRPSDGAILTPLKAGDSVIPAHLADNLFKWGAISPDKFITNPFVGKWSAEGGSSVTNNADYTAAPQTVEMHFDSLFHIEGNVDESVMPRLENLGKSLVNDRDFQKNVIKFVTKDFVRESKKQGIR